MNGRLINTNTGVTFYNTKNSNLGGFGTKLWRIHLSRGEALLRLKTRLFGMKRNGFPCIVLLAGDLFYKKYSNLEPKPMNNVNQRAFNFFIKKLKKRFYNYVQPRSKTTLKMKYKILATCNLQESRTIKRGEMIH